VSESTAGKRPNVLFILTDNQGWGDVSIYGCPYFQTPHMDKLATEGMRFTHAYSSAPMCTPSRVAFYTGRYPGRVGIGLRETLPIVSVIGDKIGLPPEHPTVATLLKANGYDTALIGKWHCGHLPSYSPLKNGFDEYFGNRSGSIDYFRHTDSSGKPDLWENDTSINLDGQYITDLYSNRAVDYINRQHDNPFFLCLFYNAPHWPWESSKDKELSDTLIGKDNTRNWLETGAPENYAELMRDLDAGIGRVMAALEQKGIADDTLVVFASDQGGDEFSHTGPFRRGRLHENGIRVPLFFRWPGVIAPHQVSEQMVIGMDISATILSATGTEPDSRFPFDGEDLLPVLTRKKPLYPRKFFWRHHGHPRPGIPLQRALRSGNWKYYRSGDYERLYDLATDEMEVNDVKDKFPDVFQALRKEYDQWESQMLPYDLTDRATNPGMR
jgi:arylsulfatase A-like enzyme